MQIIKHQTRLALERQTLTPQEAEALASRAIPAPTRSEDLWYERWRQEDLHAEEDAALAHLTPAARRAKRPTSKYRPKYGQAQLKAQLIAHAYAIEPPPAIPSIAQGWRSWLHYLHLLYIPGMSPAHNAWHALAYEPAKDLSGGYLWVLRDATIAQIYNMRQAHLNLAIDLFERNAHEHERCLLAITRAGYGDARWHLRLWRWAALIERGAQPSPTPLPHWQATPHEDEWLSAWYTLWTLSPRGYDTLLNHYLAGQQAAQEHTPLQAPEQKRWAALLPQHLEPAAALMWPPRVELFPYAL